MLCLNVTKGAFQLTLEWLGMVWAGEGLTEPQSIVNAMQRLAPTLVQEV